MLLARLAAVAFARTAARKAPVAFPSGKVASAASRMRVGEHLRFALQFQLNATAPLPSSVGFADSFPQGKLKGPQQIGTAKKERRCVPTGGVEPRPYGTPGGAVCGPMWSSAPSGVLLHLPGGALGF